MILSKIYSCILRGQAFKVLPSLYLDNYVGSIPVFSATTVISASPSDPSPREAPLLALAPCKGKLLPVGLACSVAAGGPTV